MRYGIDLDGVLGNFGARVIDAANALWPGKIAQDFVPDNWDYVGTLTAEEFKEVWTKIKSTPYFWEDEPPAPGLKELQHDLWVRFQEYAGKIRQGLDSSVIRDEIYFITARAVTKGDSPMVQSSHWLQTYGLWPRDGFSTVIPVADARQKKELFGGLGLKFMLDDYAPTVKELNEIEGMHAFVLDQPWNRYMKELPRVYSVTEYLDTIRKL